METTAYYLLLNGEVDQLDLSQKMRILPINIQDKVLKYQFRKDTNLSILAYLLLWVIISEKSKKVKKFSIDFGQHGKPYFVNSSIKFNLSHCETGIVVCISPKEVGVDIQNIVHIDLGVIDLVCGTGEKERISKSKNATDLFVKYWCLKESYLKNLGFGLGVLDLRGLDFSNQTKNKFRYDKKNFVVKSLDTSYLSICADSKNIYIKKIKLEELIKKVDLLLTNLRKED